MGKQLMLKPEKCTGCRTCELICSYNRAKDFNPRNSAVSVMIYDEAAIAVPVMCLQCGDACCVGVCPVHAMYRAEDGTTIKCDTQKCIVCKMCVNACPLGCASYSRKAGIVKCELCGGDPMCVKYCPSGALVYSEESDALGRKKAMALVLKDVFGEEVSA